MEGRPNRGRGASWKRGGGGGQDSEGSGGEHRGRGRGGHHRGRGKRDHHRGRGRGGSAAGFQHRGTDDKSGLWPEGENGMEVFSRRKLESNWDRYAESEKQEPASDTPTQRGTNYHVLLESAGDSFSQFRFSEEKDWEVDSSAFNQITAVFVDLPTLAQRLQELPLHQRLNLEAELVQVSTPVEVPTMSVAPSLDAPSFAPPPSVSKGPKLSPGLSLAAIPASVTPPPASCAPAKPPVDDTDEELDLLLGLDKPDSNTSVEQPIEVTAEETTVHSHGPEDMKEEVEENKVPAKQEVTEEDLEDWLDNMIS